MALFVLHIEPKIHSKAEVVDLINSYNTFENAATFAAWMSFYITSGSTHLQPHTMDQFYNSKVQYDDVPDTSCSGAEIVNFFNDNSETDKATKIKQLFDHGYDQAIAPTLDDLDMFSGIPMIHGPAAVLNIHNDNPLIHSDQPIHLPAE